jgi:hypothetical protein
VKYIDPDGASVVTRDEKSQENIKNTLTIEETQFVKFNEDGILDNEILNLCESISENMTALKALANSDIAYVFSVSDQDHSDECFHDTSDTSYYYGITEIPNNLTYPSPDNNVYIIVADFLLSNEAVQTTAEEAYGHAYFYELNQQGLDVDPNHTRDVLEDNIVYDPILKMYSFSFGFSKSNEKLETQIETVRNQALRNYQSKLK